MTEITLETFQEKYSNIEKQFNSLNKIIETNQESIDKATKEYNKVIAKMNENINNARNEQVFLQGAANTLTELIGQFEAEAPVDVE